MLLVDVFNIPVSKEAESLSRLHMTKMSVHGHRLVILQVQRYHSNNCPSA